jgi:hypothetical protein
MKHYDGPYDNPHESYNFGRGPNGKGVEVHSYGDDDLFNPPTGFESELGSIYGLKLCSTRIGCAWGSHEHHLDSPGLRS